jgi:NAD(P)-dependent dehydrogenase (short-subunit alcohol dehydrogenase family)
MTFENKVVLITGPAGGLGQAVTRRFAEAGARLALMERSQEKLYQAFGDLEDAILIGGADVTSEESINQAVKTVIIETGQIDVLVNIAGGWHGGTPVHETDPSVFDFLMNLNARSVFLMARAVVPHMLEREQGVIVSIAAKAALGARANNGIYSASKSAIVHITESMAAGLKHHNINVNCVLPSIIDTPANREMMSNADFSKWVTPDALADVIMFLASDAARAIHGAAIPVFGRV